MRSTENLVGSSQRDLLEHPQDLLARLERRILVRVLPLCEYADRSEGLIRCHLKHGMACDKWGKWQV